MTRGECLGMTRWGVRRKTRGQCLARRGGVRRKTGGKCLTMTKREIPQDERSARPRNDEVGVTRNDGVGAQK